MNTTVPAVAVAMPKGIGIVRVSDDAGRKAQGRLHSVPAQIETIMKIAEAHGIEIVEIFDETDVSGDTPIELRPYGRAIERVEAREIQAIVFAYRSRHDRDVVEGDKAIKRMDAADGVLLAGHEALTHATPDQWFQATVGSLFTEYQKRQIAHLIAQGVEKAVALGRVPGPSAMLGFELVPPNNTIRPVTDAKTLKLVRDAYDLRASGATIDAVRKFLAANGHVRSYRAVCRLLTSRLYIGEIRYGGSTREDGTKTPIYENRSPGFDAIVDLDVWERVQKMYVPAGRNCKSERLLARQDVLHCDGCGGRMIVGTTKASNGEPFAYYRCGRQRANGCTSPASMKAEWLEELVSDATRAHLADATAVETAVAEAVGARDDALTAEKRFKRARRLLVLDDAVEDDEAQEQLDELRGDFERKRAIADELERSAPSARSVNAARDWHLLTLDEKRALIRDAVVSVRVRGGRGLSVAERSTITLKSKQSMSRAA